MASSSFGTISSLIVLYVGYDAFGCLSQPFVRIWFVAQFCISVAVCVCVCVRLVDTFKQALHGCLRLPRDAHDLVLFYMRFAPRIAGKGWA